MYYSIIYNDEFNVILQIVVLLFEFSDLIVILNIKIKK